jgi:hypothetical protein
MNDAKYATAEETIRNAKSSAITCCRFIHPGSPERT